MDAFSDKQKVSELKDHYQKGGLADKIIKEVLLNELLEFIRPIRDKREALVNDHVLERLHSDTKESRRVVQENVSSFKSSINFK